MAVQKAHRVYDARDGETLDFKDEHGHSMTKAEALSMAAPPPPASIFTINGWLCLYAEQNGGGDTAHFVRDMTTPDTPKIYPYMTGWFADGFDYALLDDSDCYIYGNEHSIEVIRHKGERENEKMIADGWEQTAVRAASDYDYSNDLWGIRFTRPEQMLKGRKQTSHYFFRRKHQR